MSWKAWWIGAALAAGVLGRIAVSGPPPPRLTDLPCEARDTQDLAGAGDLYCVTLVPTPDLTEMEAYLELTAAASPFGVAVDTGGHHRHQATLDVRGLPDPATLGEYTGYVAWLTTPLLYPTTKLGEVRNGRTPLGEISLDKFLILVSAEAGPDGPEREGRLMFRGFSPSFRQQPPDLTEFLLGAAAPARNPPGEPDEPSGTIWRTPPMPSGVPMLPAMMQLSPPAVTPYLPSAENAARARPREVVRLEDGDTLALDATFVRRSVRERDHVMYGFNGQYPGPLIWVPQHATVTVNFRNLIDMPTTVHWHGLRLDNRSDGVPGITQDPVPPGGAYRYTLRFPDAGLYWYHPHHREDVQQDLGLYGNMMVRSARPDYYSPANREEVLVLDDLLADESGLFPFGWEQATHTMMGRFGNILLVNGEPRYTLRVGTGEVVRYFLTNVANTRTFNVVFVGANTKVVASDVGNFEREEWTGNVVIAPAERYVVHSRYPRPGRYAIENRVQGMDHVYGRFFPEVDTLGFVTVADDPATPDYGASFEVLRRDPGMRVELVAMRPHFDRPVDHELVLTLETGELPFVVDRLMRVDSSYFNPVEWSGTMPMMNWISTPDEARWILRDPATGRENMDIDWTFSVGDVVKIRVHNQRHALHAMQHPLHIHGQRFLVLEQNGVPNDNLVWKDTVLLPVGTSTDILLEITNPGRWMVHCHIAEHLESGMRMAFLVN